MPPTVTEVKADGCAARIGNKGSIAPGKLPKAIVAGRKTSVALRKASLTPSARMLSPRMSAGVSNPLTAESAITSSNGTSKSEGSRSIP